MPKVTMYPGWQYVLVEAGPGQAAAWRGKNTGSMWWHDVLPDLMFPAGRSWLVSALCDDGWACIGGPAGLVDRILVHRTCRHGHCSPAKTPPRQATTRSDPRADSRSRPTRSPAMAANRRPPTACLPDLTRAVCGYLCLPRQPGPAQARVRCPAGALLLRLPAVWRGVALSWHAVWPGAVARRGSRRVCSARSSVALLADR
jgi:hypothetical protein